MRIRYEYNNVEKHLFRLIIYIDYNILYVRLDVRRYLFFGVGLANYGAAATGSLIRPLQCF